jgi:hypothetical protein
MAAPALPDRTLLLLCMACFQHGPLCRGEGSVDLDLAQKTCCRTEGGMRWEMGCVWCSGDPTTPAEMTERSQKK